MERHFHVHGMLTQTQMFPWIFRKLKRVYFLRILTTHSKLSSFLNLLELLPMCDSSMF